MDFKKIILSWYSAYISDSTIIFGLILLLNLKIMMINPDIYQFWSYINTNFSKFILRIIACFYMIQVSLHLKSWFIIYIFSYTDPNSNNFWSFAWFFKSLLSKIMNSKILMKKFEFNESESNKLIDCILLTWVYGDKQIFITDFLSYLNSSLSTYFKPVSLYLLKSSFRNHVTSA